jgi:NADPH:quinone reductase-like Zn-dependent oxidoreductase
MKAIRIHAYGGSDQMKLENVNRPEPKEHQVLVQVFDAGVNPVDWKIREGYLKDVRPTSFPFTLGQDFAGKVLAVGTEVRGFKPGDRVYGFAHGSYAENALVDEHKIARIPDSVDDITAASLPTAGITAYQLIMNSTQLKEGQRILIQGAGGGVGSFAVQLALWKKAEIFATASDADIDYLRSLGVKKIINFQKEKFEDRVRDMDVVIDLVGGDTLRRSFDVVKKGGVIASTVGPIDPKLAEQKGIRAISFLAQQNSEDLEAMARLVEQGVLKPRINEVVPLDQAMKAQDDLKQGHSKGKIILRVNV